MKVQETDVVSEKVETVAQVLDHERATVRVKAACDFTKERGSFVVVSNLVGGEKQKREIDGIVREGKLPRRRRNGARERRECFSGASDRDLGVAGRIIKIENHKVGV